jgi:hypothetical protein
MVRAVRKTAGTFSARIAFVSAGESLGASPVQPDLLARVRGSDRNSSRRVAMQISCLNKLDYEARKAVELSQTEGIDLVAVVTRNKRTRKALERKIKETLPVAGGEAKGDGGGKREGEGRPGGGLSGAEAGKPDGGLGTVGKEHGCPVTVVDFETCVSAGYDWSWVLEDVNDIKNSEDP